MILPFGPHHPDIAPTAWIAPSADVIGDVAIGADASIWFHAVLRGDVERIRVGAGTNIQDHATLHVTRGRFPTIVGDRVTVGHAAVVHGCRVASHCLIGIGAILLDGVEVGTECLVGAGSLLTPGTQIPPRSLVLGSPARRVRELTADEIARLHETASHYVEHAARYRAASPA